MPGRFIALEGTDGVGKTSLARHLADIGYDAAAARLARPGASTRSTVGAETLVFVGRRQVSATSRYSATLMEHLSRMLWHSGDAPDLSDAFWASLQAAWFTAHTETVLAPLLEAGFDVLVDGWLYKFFAKLLLQGFTEADLDVIFARVRMPDAVLLLHADVGALYDRRSTFRPAELGMHAGYGALDDLGRDTFVDYQTKTAHNLQRFADRHGWATAQLELGEPIPATADRLAPIIAELRATPGSTPTAGARRNGAIPR
ncbi:dTMP kinase [Amycolatopsis sp. NPDC059021]|uniref:dTMP kinase n=1 Tax=Amycolatopsis sp. NPDC059021 TaxID=3346704 RepID=UPI00367122EC